MACLWLYLSCLKGTLIMRFEAQNNSNLKFISSKPKNVGRFYHSGNERFGVVLQARGKRFVLYCQICHRNCFLNEFFSQSLK